MQANAFSIGQVRAFWNGVAAEYDRINASLNWSHTERFETMKRFLPDRRSLTMVNIWSRTGNAIPAIRSRCPDAVIENFEASDQMIAIAKKRYPQEKFSLTDLHDLPCDTSSMDVAVSLETLEHVPDPLHFLLECSRILKPGGRLILSTPPAWAEWPLRLYERFFENHGEGPHRFRTISEMLRTLRRCDFDIVDHRGTVLLPVGPRWLKKAAEYLQEHFLRHVLTNRFTIRHFFVAEKKAGRDPVWAKIEEEIIRPGLSMHSGTEIGLSKGTLTLSDPDGAALPAPTGKGPIPQICYDASPEVRPSYPAMNRAVFGKSEPKSLLLGEYRRIAIAHSTDEAIRRNAASGGVLTAALMHLLEEKKIRGAVVLTMDQKHPWRAVPMIARTKEEILASAQSKYAVSPVNTILDRLEQEEGPLAYVGLPHQVFAIRRLQQLKHPSVAAIRFVFGPFFGNELSGSSIDSFLRKFGAKKSDLVSLSYRAGEWPGSMEAKLKDGRAFRMPKFHANYLIPFHITQNSLLSHDLTNEFTDLSGGDAWAPVYEERGKGFSLLITRTEGGDALIAEMERAGKLWIKDISEEEACAMQSHGLDLKKRGTFLRLERRRKNDLRIPDYGLRLVSVSFPRRIFESLLGIVFSVCAHPVSRAIADRTPHWIIGPLFQRFRILWKTATKDVKKSSKPALAVSQEGN
ncbi:Coenzyme F420 hydrogenase/dehydrogenase, beta subunit C-terminal domain [Candidatus Peregrinibacteria bacterium]|nr:Coenzyme F420 hydrogenase/dehydrogenase, beta subunit C-terminal domain [Candidatus Peregrinibacteria bacterium]